MRDVERLREKLEFSLDGRQAWALALSVLILLGAAFTVGVMVGRRTAPAPQAPSGDLAAMDGAAVVPKKPAPAPMKPAPVAVAAAEPAEAEAAPAVEKPAPEKAAEKPAEKHDAQGRAPMVVAPAPAHAATVAPPAPTKTTQVAPPPAPMKVASATPVTLTPPPRDVGNFTVQIGASQDRAEALRMESKARAAGLRPYAVEANLGARGTWYRVRVGVFKDKSAADDYRRDVERELRAPAVVMPSK